jgi:hypothetical protein
VYTIIVVGGAFVPTKADTVSVPAAHPKSRNWSLGCVAYQLARNILNILLNSHLWKMIAMKEGKNRLNVVILIASCQRWRSSTEMEKYLPQLDWARTFFPKASA